MFKSKNLRKDFEKCEIVNVVREIKAIVNNYLTM